MAGILNAAVWLGAAVFVTFLVGPALETQAIQQLLGPKSYPYFSGAIGLLVVEPYYKYLQPICASLAVIHLVAGWLYSGKIPARWWRGLILGLAALSLLSGFWWQPKLRQLHLARFAVNLPAEKRENANRVFRTWQTVASVSNLIGVAGLAVYLWRVANPPDPTRFVSSVKFRS